MVRAPLSYWCHRLAGVMPLMKPRTTTAIGSGLAVSAMVTFGSGTSITWLGTISAVCSNHQLVSWLRICPLYGTWPTCWLNTFTRSVEISTRRPSDSE